MSKQTAPIDLPLPRVICATHGEPFRAEWPKGYPAFALGAFKKLVDRNDFREEVEADRDEKEKLARAMERALDKFPMCCRLGQRELLELYEGCGVGVVKVCAVCFCGRVGTPYTLCNPDRPGEHKTLKHVCFNCLVYRLRSYK